MILGRKVQLIPASGWRSSEAGFDPKVDREAFWIQPRATKVTIGEVYYINDICGQKAEIVIEIRPFYRGQGFGEDALYHLLDHLFMELLYQEVVLFVVVGNQRAKKLYLRLGFEHIMLHIQGAYDDQAEELVDLEEMLLRRDRWLRRRKDYIFKE